MDRKKVTKWQIETDTQKDRHTVHRTDAGTQMRDWRRDEQ